MPLRSFLISMALALCPGTVHRVASGLSGPARGEAETAPYLWGPTVRYTIRSSSARQMGSILE